MKTPSIIQPTQPTVKQDKGRAASSIKNFTPNSSKSLEKTKRVMSDSWITAKVKSAILADNVGNGVDVSVETMYGVVVLTGTLPNQNAIDHVKNIARRVDSVKSVISDELVVARK